jgi:hypothetical protein
MKKILNVKISVLIMILLPLLSILIGFFGVKLYLLSNNIYSNEVDVVEINIAKDIKEKNIENLNLKFKTISFNEISFFTIQMGAFSQEKNAIEFVNELNDKDIDSFYISNDNYTVYSFASNDKESLTINLELCKKEISDSFIKQIVLKSGNISYYIESNDYLLTVVNGVSEHFINVSSNNIDYEYEIGKLTKMKKEISSLLMVSKENELVVNKITNYLDALILNKELLLKNDSSSIDNYILENVKAYINYLIK